jgi:glycine cleavage system H protein
MNPTDRRYSKEHEWARVESPGLVVMGITHYAQDQLGDVVYVELPSPGAEVNQFQKLGEIESVKAVSDLFAPIGGKIVETNGELEGQPELVNDDPTGDGWMIKLRAENVDDEMTNLLSAEEYEAFLESEAH